MRYMDHFHIVVFEKCCGLENETKCNNILLVCGSQCTIFHAIIMSFYALVPYSKSSPDSFCGEYICVHFNMPYFVYFFARFLSFLSFCLSPPHTHTLSFSTLLFLLLFCFRNFGWLFDGSVGWSDGFFCRSFVCLFIHSCIHSKLSVKVT